METLLKNKKILITGVRNKWSLAWGIAEAVADSGGEIILTAQSERESGEIRKLAESLDKPCPVYECDITSDQEIEDLFQALREDHGRIHGMVHAIAHARSEDLKGDFIETSREGFVHALEVSAFSLIALSRKARDLMQGEGSILTLTYMGSEKVISDYKIMGVAKAALERNLYYLAPDLGKSGIRINAISAGPVKTMSARGISNFTDILSTVRKKAPLERNITQEDIGRTALFLLSDLSAGITGEILHVDCGFNIMGI